MTSQYKITYRYVENGVTKEDDIIIDAENEPTREEVNQYFKNSGHHDHNQISVVAIAPYP